MKQRFVKMLECALYVETLHYILDPFLLCMTLVGISYISMHASLYSKKQNAEATNFEQYIA